MSPTMSPKELLYIEDALGHEEFFMTQCRQAAEQLKDEDLRSYARQLCDRHQKVFGQFYSLV